MPPRPHTPVRWGRSRKEKTVNRGCQWMRKRSHGAWKYWKGCWPMKWNRRSHSVHSVAPTKDRALDSRLSSGFPKADPETKTHVQVVYLEGDPKKAEWRRGQSEMGKKGRQGHEVQANMKVPAVGSWGSTLCGCRTDLRAKIFIEKLPSLPGRGLPPQHWITEQSSLGIGGRAGMVGNQLEINWNSVHQADTLPRMVDSAARWLSFSCSIICSKLNTYKVKE